MNPQPARADVELRMTEAMVDCAQALAMGFGEACRVEEDFDRRLKLHDAFQRGFTAVRLGIRLSMALRAGRAPAGFAAANDAAANDATGDHERPEAPEREAAEAIHDPRERETADRDRDYEPVSLARFLSTLRGVAADAAREPGVADPAVLPVLNRLLAQAEGETPAPRPAPASATVTLLTRPPAPAPRSRLLGSAAPPLSLVGRPRPPPRPSG